MGGVEAIGPGDRQMLVLPVEVRQVQFPLVEVLGIHPIAGDDQHAFLPARLDRQLQGVGTGLEQRPHAGGLSVLLGSFPTPHRGHDFVVVLVPGRGNLAAINDRIRHSHVLGQDFHAVAKHVLYRSLVLGWGRIRSGTVQKQTIDIAVEDAAQSLVVRDLGSRSVRVVCRRRRGTRRRSAAPAVSSGSLQDESCRLRRDRSRR